MITGTATSPNEVAQSLTNRDYVSWSAISTYQRCPLRYFFRYVEDLPEETVSASLVFGGAIHRAVELHFNEILYGNPPPEIDMLLDEYQQAWNERDQTGIQFGKTEDVNTLGQLAERMLTAFQTSDFAKPTGTIVGIEEELRGELVKDCPDLLARIDLLVDDGDSLVVTDLKTARSRWSQSQVDESGEQLTLYSALVRRLMLDKPVRLQFAVVTKTKTPALEVHEVEFNQHRLDRSQRIVQRVWQAVQAGHFYPNPSPMNCSSCPFRRPCRAWCG